MGSSRRLLGPAFALGLATVIVQGVAGCGSESESGAPISGAGPSAGADVSDATLAADSEPDSPAGDYATVTIDGTTYEATGTFTCITLGGSVNAELISGDDLVRIGVSLPPLDAAPGEWPAPSVYLRDDTDPADQLHLASGDEVAGSFEAYADVAVVHDYTIEGKTGAGSATFIDPGRAMAGEAEPVDGTFTVGCST